MTGKSKILYLLTALIIFMGILRFLYISAYSSLPLSGDAPGFAALSSDMKNFYGCSPREPFWILWTKTAIVLSGDPATGMRSGNVILSLAAAVMIYLLLLKSSSILPAASGSFFFLIIPYLYFSAVRAHRLEMYFFLSLLYTYTVMFCINKRYWPVLAGLAAALLILVRMEAILLFAAGLIYAFFTLKERTVTRFKKIALTLLVTATAAGPFFYNCYREKGSPFFVLDNHAKFYFRHEQAVKGRISVEEALKRPYDAPGTGLFSYLLNRRPQMIMRRFINGYIKILTDGTRALLSRPVNLSFLIYPVWLGIAVMLFYPGGRRLLFWGLLYMLPYSFIASTHLAGQPSVDIRFAATVSPLLCFGFGYFSLGLLDIARRFINMREKKRG